MADTLPLPSNRKFGLLFFAVFAILGGLSWWRGNARYPFLLAISAAFLLVALLAPDVLRPLNRAWMAFAHLLHKVTSPIILGAMFFVLFAPVGFVMRLGKRDLMRRRFDPNAGSYWLPRVPPGPPGETLRNQF